MDPYLIAVAPLSDRDGLQPNSDGPLPNSDGPPT